MPVPDGDYRTTATSHPTAFKAGLKEGEVFTIIWDTGASFTITPHIEDFVGEMQPFEEPIKLTGLAQGLSITGKGMVKWVVTTTDGSLKTIEVEAYYTPDANIRLLSPQSYLQQLRRTKQDIPVGEITSNNFTLTWPDSSQVELPYNPINNLPVCQAYNEATVIRRTHELNLCVTDTNNQNLSEAQKELLRWHFRLGHLSFEAIQMLLRSGTLAQSEGAKQMHRNASKCPHPKCASCQFGKQKRRPSPSKAVRSVVSNEGALKKGNLLPGQRVSVDHFVCNTKGRLYTSKGKTRPETMYSGGCIQVDHASGFVNVEHQVSLNTHETLRSKLLFEAKARDVGVIIQSYQSDNGAAFTSDAYVQELSTFKQTTTFAGVGAHHHNGVAERSIQTIMSMARTMMLHAAIRWPDAADTSLWPMAVDYAVHIFNHMPNPKTGLSPMDVFSGTKWPTHKCNDLQVWGCPVYVLDSTMQDGKKLPRWKTRSRRAVYVGLSKKHAATAPLVLNLTSLYISPQFHCVFDCWFATVIATATSIPDLKNPIWDKLFGESRFQYTFDDYLPPDLGDDWNDLHASTQLSDTIRTAQDAPSSQQPVPLATPMTSPLPPTPTTSSPDQDAARTPPPRPITADRVVFPEDAVSPPRESRVTPTREPIISSIRPPRFSPSREPPAPSPRRSTRSNFGQPAVAYKDEYNMLAALLGDDLFSSPEDITNFAALVAKASDPDTLTYDEALRDDDSDLWKEKMNLEITSLIKQGTWEIVKKSDASTKILPGTWTLRRKRNPDGTLKGHKARWCVRGDLQPPEEDTYAPVVMWSTIRLVMYYTLFFDLKTRCIDFSNAFVQAPLDDPIYVHLPRGFHSTDDNDVCLKLTKSLYGITQAPRLWFNHLKSKLLHHGFTQSTHDPCLFYSKTIMLVIWGPLFES